MKANTYFNWPGKVWIFSDPHFGDRGILRYERTQFKTTDEHDEFILKAINSTIQKGDTLVCLGDLGFGWERVVPRIKKCAKKVLVLGNHDGFGKNTYKEYFDEVYSGPLFVNKFIVLSHEPIPTSEHFINVHGHLHGSVLDEKQYVNASIAMANYKMIALDDLQKKIANAPRIKANFLEEWYADKYVFDRKKTDAIVYNDTLHIVPRDIIEKAISRIRAMYFKDPNEQKLVEELRSFVYGREYNCLNITVKQKDKEDIQIERLSEQLLKLWEEKNAE